MSNLTPKQKEIMTIVKNYGVHYGRTKEDDIEIHQLHAMGMIRVQIKEMRSLGQVVEVLKALPLK